MAAFPFFHFLKHQSIGQPYLFSAESQNCCEQCKKKAFLINHGSSSLINCPALLSLCKHLKMCRKMSCWTYFIFCFALDSSAVQYDEKRCNWPFFKIILNKTQRPMTTLRWKPHFSIRKLLLVFVFVDPCWDILPLIHSRSEIVSCLITAFIVLLQCLHLCSLFVSCIKAHKCFSFLHFAVNNPQKDGEGVTET